MGPIAQGSETEEFSPCLSHGAMVNKDLNPELGTSFTLEFLGRIPVSCCLQHLQHESRRSERKHIRDQSRDAGRIAFGVRE